MTAGADQRPVSALEGGFAIGDLRVDPRSGEIAGPGGRQQLDPKVMGVLVLLAQKPGQVVSREELLAQLWPQVVVTDDALSRCIHELRRHLTLAGGSEDCRALVETLPKRGYRLKAAPKKAAAPAPRARAKSTTWRRTGFAVAALAAAGALFLLLARTSPDTPASVAVIPFADMSPGQDQGWFADGVAEEILNHLSQSKDLRVIGRRSSFSLRQEDLDVREIARRLGVTHVLEGSVRKSGDDLRVTAQLIDGNNGSHVWSHTFENRQGDLFAIQDEIAAGVAAALDVALVPRPDTEYKPSRKGHDNFMLGEFYYNRRRPGDFDRAIAAYRDALATDPDYARAWASLSAAYSFKAREFDPPDAGLLEPQRLAAERAVELDPKLAIAHIRLGQYLGETGQKGKERHFAAARQLDPGHPIIVSWAATLDVERGDLPGAIDKLQQAVAREPLLAVYRTNLAAVLMADGQLDRALKEFQLTMEMSPGNHLGAQADIVRILVLQGRHEEAKRAVAELPDGKRRDFGLALLSGDPRARPEADAALARMQADSDEGGTADEVLDTIQLAEAYAIRGNHEGAMATLLSKAEDYARTKGRQSVVLWYLTYEARLSPFFRPLHADPRWPAFIESQEDA